jgi:hypothetical protein
VLVLRRLPRAPVAAPATRMGRARGGARARPAAALSALQARVDALQAPTSPLRVVSVNRVGLVQACQDPNLLGIDLHPRQREILEQIDSGRFHEIVLVLGRRSGKSLMAAAVAVHDACFRDLTRYLRPRQARHVVVVAANREQAGIVLGYVRELLTNSPLLKGCIAAETAESIEVRQPHTGAPALVKTMPCSARAGRGLAISTLIADEIGHWLDATEGPAVADRVWGSLTPALADFHEHGRALAISTPWGNSNLLAQLFKRATSGDHADMLAVRAATWQMRPDLQQSYFDRERAKDPELFRGEFGAEFLASGAAFFDPERLEAAVDEDRFELPPGQITEPVVGLDPSFSADPFGCVVVGRGVGHLEDRAEGRPEDRRRRFRVAAVRSWRPTPGRELSVEPVLDEIAALCRRYGAHSVVTDQWCSAPVRQGLARRGISAHEKTLTASSKAGVFSDLKSLVYTDSLELYRHEGLLSELKRVEAHYASGSVSIRIPRVAGSHGDMACALALAVSAATKRGGGQIDPSWSQWVDSGAGANPRPRVDGDGLPVETDEDDTLPSMAGLLSRDDVW